MHGSKYLRGMIKRSLGRSEEVALPQLNWHSVEARVDTGAYHCAIHCINYHVDGTARRELAQQPPHAAQPVSQGHSQI